MTSFDENDFINYVICNSYNNNITDFTIYIKEYISNYCDTDNLYLIFRYAMTLENAIYIYQELYRNIIIINNAEEPTYAELTYIILYHNFYDIILSQILDNNLCSDEDTDKYIIDSDEDIENDDYDT